MGTCQIVLYHMTKNASMGSAATAPSGPYQQPMMNLRTLLRRNLLYWQAPLQESARSGCGSCGMTNLTGSPSARASVKLACEVNPEDLYWQAAIITDKEVALEDHRGDNTSQLTRGSDLVVQSAQSLAAEIPVCMYRVL